MTKKWELHKFYKHDGRWVIVLADFGNKYLVANLHRGWRDRPEEKNVFEIAKGGAK